MALIPDKMFLFLCDSHPTLVHSTKALNWSFDNRVIICCAEKIRIVNTVANSDFKNDKADAFVIKIDETPDVSSLNQFSFTKGLLNFRESLHNISEGEKHELSLDPSLTEECLYPNPIYNTFKRAVYSPLCSTLDRPHSLIAAVTSNHRVVIFAERYEGWCPVDFSAAVKQHAISDIELPVTIGETITFSEYINLVHSMSTTELEWSSVFSCSGYSEPPFSLFFTATRSGSVTAWKVSLPFETEADFTFQHTDTYASEVTALSWHSTQQDQGLLAVGYLNGSIRILSVCVSNDLSTSCVDVTEVFADHLNDGLAISDLAWAKIDEVTTVLICSKQYFLSLYSIHGDAIKLVDNYHMDVGLPLTSISVFGASGFAASKDGDFISFQLKQVSGQIRLDWSTMAVACLPFSSELPRFCLGVTMSPSCGFFLSVHRLLHNAKVTELRKKFLSSQMVTLSIPFKLTTDSVMTALNKNSSRSPQEIMINIRLCIQQTTLMAGSLCEILEIYTKLKERGDIQSLQVARDMLLFLKHCSAQKAEYQKELVWLDSSYDEISKKLVTKHIGSCLQNVSSPSSNELSIIKAMMTWVSTRNVMSYVSNLDLASLDKVCQGSDNPRCAICGSDFSVTGFLLAKCDRGHQAKLCAVTLLPCQSMPGRKCEACCHPSVNLSVFTGVKIITQKWSCVLCGGYLRDSVL